MEGDDDELKQHKPHINSNFLLLSTKELNGDCSLKKKKNNYSFSMLGPLNGSNHEYT